jgi:hemoglobin
MPAKAVAASDRQRSRATAERIGRAAMTHVVDVFYDRIQQHPTLAKPFRIVSDWDEHKAKLTHFWWISLGGQAYANYKYSVVSRHISIGVTDSLVDDWLALFDATMRETLSAELADEWMHRAHHMGRSIRMLGDF